MGFEQNIVTILASQPFRVFFVREQNDRHAALEVKQNVLIENFGFCSLQTGQWFDVAFLQGVYPTHHISGGVGRQLGKCVAGLLQLFDTRVFWVVQPILS